MQLFIEPLTKYLKIALYVSHDSVRNHMISMLSDSSALAVIDSRGKFNPSDAETIASPNVAIVYMGGDLQESARTVTAIKRYFSDAMILAIVEVDEFDQVMNLLKAGASGVVTADYLDHLHEPIEDLISGGSPLPRRSARKLIESFQRNVNSPLTSRETDVMIAMAQGKSYKLIAQDLYVHPETVKTHMKNIYGKLSVRSKAEAIEVAKRDRLI